MSFYFHISTGLRGCYMPDNSGIVRVETRRALKEIIADEAGRYRDSGYVGASKSAIANLAARAWRDKRKFTLDHCLPLAPPHAKKNHCEGIFVSRATRSDWEESQESK